MSVFSDEKILGLKIHDMLIDEDPLGQVKFVRLLKVTVLICMRLMKPEIKLTISNS